MITEDDAELHRNIKDPKKMIQKVFEYNKANEKNELVQFIYLGILQIIYILFIVLITLLKINRTLWRFLQGGSVLCEHSNQQWYIVIVIHILINIYRMQ